MKDLIDERNFREKCSRSIVKGYNVHYVTKEELEAVQSAEGSGNETEQPGNKSSILQQTQPGTKEPETDPSACKAAGDDDSVTKEQIDKILGEKEENLQNTIEQLMG